jgi:hypothetical protein
MNNLIVILFSMMMTASVLWPSEGAINGDGLHLTILWLITALIAVVVKRQKNGSTDSITWDRTRSAATAFMVMLLAGFWLSTWNVFHVQGDRRAALNLAFEWSGIVAGFLTIACWFRRQNTLHSIVALIIGLAAGTAVLGIWQHHVSYAQRTEWYQQQRSELDRTLQQNDIQSSMKRSQLEGAFKRMKLPLHGSERQLFERRLMDSSEPVGPFALANTLGGVLAVAVVLLIAGVIQALRRNVGISVLGWCITGVSIFVLTYCLLLTKSRTAWVGCTVGTMVLVGRLRTGKPAAGLVRLGVGAAILIAATMGIGISTGAIDREVIMEAPRSLQFRLLYWTGAAGVIKDNPMFGAGPGNFRQVYLRHKSVESSEDILDPHNILLDVWCSAGLCGLIALVGLLVCCISAIKQFRRCDFRVKKRPRRLPWPLLKGVLAGTGLHLVWRWFNGADLGATGVDSENLVLLVPLTACLLTPSIVRCLLFTQSSASAALICLSVHLLGAGGLQITILGHFFLMLAALTIFGAHSEAAAEQCQTASRTVRRTNNSLRLAAVLGLVALTVSTVRFGLIPVHRSQHQLHLADVRKTHGDRNGTLAALNQAVRSDPFSVDSRQQLTLTLAYDFQQSVERYAPTGRENPVAALQVPFDAVIASCDHLINADQRAGTGYYYRSRVSNSFWSVSNNDYEVFASAHHDLRYAVACDPTNSALWLELAEFQYEGGLFSEASTTAVRATDIDTVNRRWGHEDQYLTAKQLGRLKLIKNSADID